ncbi:aldehyde dehydrogenase family protein [Lacisediminimonas profundi]|uniref:aldehyde dehydrogenase family protein n=1 Tax=Lacisediminimonas profundi TaxID=2603856 RepID=UPI00124AFBAC|nr:aldehyde dehydrogenase family protein [Lacisediminimonas profundi]
MNRLTSWIADAHAAAGGNAFVFTEPQKNLPAFEIEESAESVIDAAVQSAQQAFLRHKRATLAERTVWLNLLAQVLEANAARFAEIICEDVGKPMRAAKFEAGRGAQFARACAAAVQQLSGEVVPVDAVAAGAGHFGFTRHVPYGVVAAITPFNAPVNLLVQKLAPALAAGNAVVAKPAPAGLRAALLLAEELVKAGLPQGLFNVVTGDKDAAVALVRHSLVRAVSFTGGTAGGEILMRHAGNKKFVSELGSNAANIVLADADLADAANKIAAAAFEASGQQCISAQRVIVEQPVIERFTALFVAAAAKLKVGPAHDPATDVGPMVSVQSAQRVMGMVVDALEKGASCALTPKQDEATVSPGILVNVPRHARLWTDEVFGPLALVMPAADIDDALALANDSPFGLQGAVFTSSLSAAFRFSEEFDVGSLWVNEASRFRLDMYPFGGMKQSGIGREGVKYAIEELTQLKFTGIKL